jgi:transcriptional regulator with XRE-family HTH domain
MHITQIVLSMSNISSDQYTLKIHKLEGRPSTNLATPHMFRIIDEEIEFEEVYDNNAFKIGVKVKGLRKTMNMTQAELASRLGMTPGAISQIENDLITPSLSTLVHLAAIFKKPVEYFINVETIDDLAEGYRIFRKKDMKLALVNNVKIARMADEKNQGPVPYLVTIPGNETHDGPILLHKGKEYIIVVNGTLGLVIDGEEHIFHKGDAVLLERSFAGRWTNQGKSECEFVYIQL